MKWVGLTGGMGCGKSTILEELKFLGCGTVSADKLVHELYQDPGVILEVCDLLKIPKNSFSMELVAKIVFTDSKKLVELENLIHPKLKDKTEAIRKEFEEKGFEISFYEVPLLFEKSLQGRFDQTVCVGADEETQLKRIKARNNWSDDEIKARLSSQLPLSEKKALADFYIDNSGTREALKVLCKKLVSDLLV